MSSGSLPRGERYIWELKSSLRTQLTGSLSSFFRFHPKHPRNILLSQTHPTWISLKIKPYNACTLACLPLTVLIHVPLYLARQPNPLLLCVLAARLPNTPSSPNVVSAPIPTWTFLLH